MTGKFSLAQFIRSLVAPHPARDWFIVLTLLVALFLGLTAYAGYVFWGIQTGTLAGNSETRGAQPKVTRADITKVLEAYRTRRVNFEAGNFPLSELSDPAR